MSIYNCHKQSPQPWMSYIAQNMITFNGECCPLLVTDALLPFQIISNGIFERAEIRQCGETAWTEISLNINTVMYDGFYVHSYSGISDWFLPSLDELQLMYDNLAAFGVGGFQTGIDYHEYWSSSEINNAAVNTVLFRTGVQSSLPKWDYAFVRGARTFISSSIWALRDVGISGGLIFHIVDNGDGTYTYYEAAPVDFDYYPSTGYGVNWSDNTTDLIGTTGEDVCDGDQNTDDILAQAGATMGAAFLCRTNITLDCGCYEFRVIAGETWWFEPFMLEEFDNDVNNYTIRDELMLPLKFAEQQIEGIPIFAPCDSFLPFMFSTLNPTEGSVTVYLYDEDCTATELTIDITIETIGGKTYYIHDGACFFPFLECGLYKLEIVDGEYSYMSVWFDAVCDINDIPDGYRPMLDFNRCVMRDDDGVILYEQCYE